MAPAVYAAETVTPAAPTGPQAKGVETTQPSKEMAKAHGDKARHDKKRKKSKPLNPGEKREMDNRMETQEQPEGSTPETPVK